MRHLQGDHGRHGLEAPRNELSRISNEVRVKAVYSADVPPVAPHEIHNSTQHWDMCKQLNLAWAVKKQVVIITKTLQTTSPCKDHIAVNSATHRLDLQ